jgi:hypothetical protein
MILHTQLWKKRCSSVLSLVIPTKQIYVTGIHNPVLTTLLLSYNKPYDLINIFNKSYLVDRIDGSKIMESKFVPVYILVPRNDVVQNSSSPHADVNALKIILNKYNNKSSSGINRSGISAKYSTLGVHCSQNKPGLINKYVRECCQSEYNHINKILCRVQQFAQMWLPYGLLSALKIITETV